MSNQKYYNFSSIYSFLLLFLPTFIWQAEADDLINARCQSKCLYELEMRHRNNSESRRLLRHQISTLCKEDVLCASCIIPCRDLISDAQICGRTLCTGIPEPNQCHHSCAFIAQIANNKPGQCPKIDQKISNGMDSECSAFCDSDGDCPEIDKCCSIGCSRTCLGPLLNDSRLLPRPEGISVQERKRKKSAILRWIMKRLTPQHTATNSNLYVIQWRWSIHKQPETMTPWQTVMVRNKMYAILKHLLAPGRFYLFRVAAVNLFGTYGFSQPSHPAFKLSKEVKAPSAPINLTVLQVPNGAEGFAKIGWTPPDSELSIKEYRLSWWKSSMEMANAFEFRQRRSSKGNGGTTTVDEDYDGGAGEMAEIDGNSEERKNLVLPNYSTKAELNGLEGGQVYMVELYATVDSSEGELRGEPAILFLKTEERRLAKTSTINPNGMNENGIDFADDGTEISPSFIAELKTPFFEGGRLKTILSWLEHPNCEENKLKWQKGTPQFRVLIRSLRCLNQLPPQQFAVQGCVATLENLQFNCEYYVRVEEFGGGEREKPKLIARLTFATLPCEQTPSDVPLECEIDEQSTKIDSNDQIGMAQPLESASKPTIGPQIRTTTKKAKNSQKVDRNGKGENETENEDEWLPIEELEAEESTKKAEKPKERGTRTKTVSGNDKNNKKEQLNQQLSCFATSRDTAECSWNWPTNFEQKNNPLIGFRTVLSSTLNGIPWNVTIVGPEQRRMHLTMLSPKAVYRFRLQAVTAHGLGAELVEHFSTVHFSSSKTMNSSSPTMDLGVNVGIGSDQFPEIVELPWGSSSTSFFSSNLSKFLPSTAIFLIMFFNYFC